MANFKRNDESVKNETFSAGPIKTTGIHTGHFTKAYIRKSKVPGAKSEAIHFDFTNSAGNFGSFDIWYQDKEGGKLDRGIAQIHNLMALLGLDELKEKKNDVIQVYDWDMREVKPMRVDSYPDLLDKYIGTVWQIEEYIKQTQNDDGEWIDSNPPQIKERAVFLRFCDAETHASPAEFLNSENPVAVDNFIAGLPEVKRVNFIIKTTIVDNKITPSVNFVDDNDDDIPF